MAWILKNAIIILQSLMNTFFYPAILYCLHCCQPDGVCLGMCQIQIMFFFYTLCCPPAVNSVWSCYVRYVMTQLWSKYILLLFATKVI